MFNNVKDICHPTQESNLTCPHNQVYYTASAIWYVRLSFSGRCVYLARARGLVGPTRQFGAGSLYQPELYAIIGGALLPFPFWLWQRRYPNSWVKFVSTPVILSGVAYIPPAGGINYSAWFATGFVFQYLVRKRNFAWWSKFNYVTSAALDSGKPIPSVASACPDNSPLGTVLSALVIFFTLAVSVIIKLFVWHGSLSMVHSSQKVASFLIGGETPFLRTVSLTRCLARHKC